MDSFEKETCLHQYHQYHLQLNKWCNSPNNNNTNLNKMIRQLLFLHFSKWALLPLPQNYDNSAAAMNSENCLTSNTPETPIVHHFSDTASTRSTSSSSSSSLSIMSGGRTASNASERVIGNSVIQ